MQAFTITDRRYAVLTLPEIDHILIHARWFSSETFRGPNGEP